MTGAPVPQGADAVVPVEWTDGGVAAVRITQAPQRDQHVRHKGEDVRAGDVLLEDGSVLGPRQLGLLASVGRSQVRLAPAAAGGGHVHRGRAARARDGAGPRLDLRRELLHARRRGPLGRGDRLPGRHRLRRPRRVPRRAVATSSSAPTSWSPAAASARAPTTWSRRCSPSSARSRSARSRCSPGKPQGFGFVGEDATPILTLPGNPVSSYVSFEVFVVPAIRRMMGRLPYRRPMVRALCSQGFSSDPGPSAVRPRAVRDRRQGRARHPRRRARLAPDGRPVRGQRADRRAARGRRRCRPASRCRCSCWTGTSDVATPEPSGSPTSTRPAPPGWSTCRPRTSTSREAVATGRVLVSPTVVGLLRGEGVPKGDALGVARVAGIMAAKRTPDLVPLCHPLAISGVTVDLAVADDAVEITATVRTTDRTGVEMEALTAVSVAGAHRRRHGQGRRQGRGDHRHPGRVEDRRQVRRLDPAVKATVVCASNRAAAGVYEDTTGPLIVEALDRAGLRGDRPGRRTRRRAGRGGDPRGRRRRARAPCSPPAAPASPRPT